MLGVNITFLIHEMNLRYFSVLGEENLIFKSESSELQLSVFNPNNTKQRWPLACMSNVTKDSNFEDT